jgi:copper transport protein
VSSELVLAANQFFSYAGYVALAGALTFWSLVWPAGHGDRRLFGLAMTGTALLSVSTVVAFALQQPGQPPVGTLSPLAGAALLVRLAALAATGFLLVDVLRSVIVGWRRVFALVVVVVLGITLVPQADGLTGPWPVLQVAVITVHVLAVPAWLGGLLALVVVLTRRGDRPELDSLPARFSLLALVGAVALVVTGVVSALLAGGPAVLAGSYGVVLAVKTLVFAAMVVLAVRGRRLAVRLAFRRAHHLPSGGRPPASPDGVLSDHVAAAGSGAGRQLAGVLRVELVSTAVVLLATAALVLVAPHP